jgi:hypothetical protein
MGFLYFISINICGWIIAGFLFALVWRFKILGTDFPEMDIFMTKLFVFFWFGGIFIALFMLGREFLRNTFSSKSFPIRQIGNIWKKVANLD